MPFDPNKGHAALRRGRFSQPQADYFLTLCTAGGLPGLDAAVIAATIWAEAESMEADGTWRVRCSVIMPDHFYALINLGARLVLSQTLQRLKAKTSTVLKSSSGLAWERGFFDRRLRTDDDELSVFLYVYLNPYRAGLLASDKKWPHYYCCEEDWAWFRTQLDQDLPPPEWLM